MISQILTVHKSKNHKRELLDQKVKDIGQQNEQYQKQIIRILKLRSKPKYQTKTINKEELYIQLTNLLKKENKVIKLLLLKTIISFRKLKQLHKAEKIKIQDKIADQHITNLKLQNSSKEKHQQIIFQLKQKLDRLQKQKQIVQKEALKNYNFFKENFENKIKEFEVKTCEYYQQLTKKNQIIKLQNSKILQTLQNQLNVFKENNFLLQQKLITNEKAFLQKLSSKDNILEKTKQQLRINLQKITQLEKDIEISKVNFSKRRHKNNQIHNQINYQINFANQQTNKQIQTVIKLKQQKIKQLQSLIFSLQSQVNKITLQKQAKNSQTNYLKNRIVELTQRMSNFQQKQKIELENIINFQRQIKNQFIQKFVIQQKANNSLKQQLSKLFLQIQTHKVQLLSVKQLNHSYNNQISKKSDQIKRLKSFIEIDQFSQKLPVDNVSNNYLTNIESQKSNLQKHITEQTYEQNQQFSKFELQIGQIRKFFQKKQININYKDLFSSSNILVELEMLRENKIAQILFILIRQNTNYKKIINQMMNNQEKLAQLNNLMYFQQFASQQTQQILPKSKQKKQKKQKEQKRQKRQKKQKKQQCCIY